MHEAKMNPARDMLRRLVAEIERRSATIAFVGSRKILGDLVQLTNEARAILHDHDDPAQIGTTAGKRKFVRDLCESIEGETIADIAAGKIPEEWNGIELRALVADRFNASRFHDLMKGKRGRDYKNEVLVRNL